ncbi:MAG: hypothetical protein ACREEB_18330 [Caulobacteraceae bacterium]
MALLVLAISLATGLLAQTPATARNAGSDTDCMISLSAITQSVPRFSDYPARVEKIAKPAAVDLRSDPEARTFRTMLRDGARNGPNFAGHFTIVGWGCGSSCLQWAVVDARSGKVSLDRSIQVVSAVYVADEQAKLPGVDYDYNALRFRRDSALVAILGAPHEDEAREGVAFYRWNGKIFQFLKFVPRAEACRNER